MNARLREIVHRRRLLVAQATEQRGDFAVHAAALRRSLSFVDAAWRGYKHLKSRPVGVAVAAVALAAFGPGRLVRMGYRGGFILMTALRLIKFIRTLR